MFKHILVPTDGSKAALEAAEAVGRLASGAADVHVTAVVVIAPYDIENTDYDPAIVEQRNAMIRRHAEEALKTTASTLAERGVACSIKILEGDPVSAILARETRLGGYDLIAMSSRGLSKQKDSLHYLGGVTEHLIRRSQIPVLVIPVSDEED